jgi:SHAQKYF class myb-like DNA-binding protein
MLSSITSAWPPPAREEDPSHTQSPRATHAHQTEPVEDNDIDHELVALKLSATTLSSNSSTTTLLVPADAAPPAAAAISVVPVAQPTYQHQNTNTHTPHHHHNTTSPLHQDAEELASNCGSSYSSHSSSSSGSSRSSSSSMPSEYTLGYHMLPAAGAPYPAAGLGRTPSRLVREGRWSKEEHTLFLAGYERYGRSWKDIASLIRSRSSEQVRTHAQKYFQKQQLSEKHRGGGSKGGVGHNNNGASLDAKRVKLSEALQQQQQQYNHQQHQQQMYLLSQQQHPQH